MTFTEELHQYTVRANGIFAALPATHFCFLVDAEGRYLALRVPDLNRLWIPEEDHIGKKFDDVLPPELGIHRRHFFNYALQTGKPQSYSYDHPITPDRRMTCQISPIVTIEGVIEEVLIQVYDSTEAPVRAANVLRSN